jgi:hypothetical protein
MIIRAVVIQGVLLVPVLFADIRPLCESDLDLTQSGQAEFVHLLIFDMQRTPWTMARPLLPGIR